MTDDLVAFLRARLDEDEQTARDAHAIDPAPWYEDVEHDGYTNQRDGHGSGLVRAADNVGLWDREQSCTLSMTAATSVHVARHDPARVLAEVDSKRRILEIADNAATDTKSPDYLVAGPARLLQSALDPVLRLLALPYGGHPDYRPEWAPSE